VGSRLRTYRWGGWLAETLLAPSTRLALIGFAGVGISIIFSLILGLAARSREVPSGTALAAVSTLGSLGFLAGPPILGIVAHSTTIGVALWLVALFYVRIAALARSVGGGEGGAAHEQIVSSGSRSRWKQRANAPLQCR